MSALIVRFNHTSQAYRIYILWDSSWVVAILPAVLISADAGRSYASGKHWHGSLNLHVVIGYASCFVLAQDAPGKDLTNMGTTYSYFFLAFLVIATFYTVITTGMSLPLCPRAMSLNSLSRSPCRLPHIPMEAQRASLQPLCADDSTTCLGNVHSFGGHIPRSPLLALRHLCPRCQSRDVWRRLPSCPYRTFHYYPAPPGSLEDDPTGNRYHAHYHQACNRQCDWQQTRDETECQYVHPSRERASSDDARRRTVYRTAASPFEIYHF